MLARASVRGLTIALGVLALAPAPAFGALVGFNDDRGAWQEHADEAREIGASVARVPIGWNVHPSTFSEVNRELEEQGLRPLICLWWVDLPTPGAYAAAVEAWARAYPRAIIQLGNEMNHPARPADPPARIVEVLNAAVRVTPESTQLVGPGLTPLDGRAPPPAYKAYARAIYSPLLDRVQPALHVYPYSGHPRRTTRRFWRVLRPHGPVWVTETGAFGAVYGDRQAEVSARLSDTLVSWGARAVVFHRLAPATELVQWELDASMSVVDDPALAAALALAWR
jgi:hypothetical protein